MKLKAKKRPTWQKALTIGLPLAAIGIGIYMVAKGNNATPPDTGNTNTNITPAVGKNYFPLKLNSGYSDSFENGLVKNLQTYLNTKLYAQNRLTVDGMFGAKTQAAVIYVLGTNTVSYDKYKQIIGDPYTK